jgi:hypothetical protein
MKLAVTAMRACRELTWGKKKGSLDAGKKAEMSQKVKENTEMFLRAYRQIVGNDLKSQWSTEVQKEYVKGAPEALLMYYLSDNPSAVKGLAHSLKKAADKYVRGWEMLGRNKRNELPGPMEITGNGTLAVQILIEQLKDGDEIQKVQAQILKAVFEKPLSTLAAKPANPPEPKGFTLGDTLSAA